MQEAEDFLIPFFSAEKPDWMTGPDCLVMACLLSESTEHSRIWLAQSTIAARTGLCRSAVVEALKELKERGWITIKSGKRQDNPNVYEVQFQNLPTTRPTPTAPGEVAQSLAVMYKTLFLQHCSKYVNPKGRTCHRKLRKDWRERWPRVIQTLLDAGNSEPFIREMFEWAVKSKPKQFQAGPQGLLKLWPKKEAA